MDEYLLLCLDVDIHGTRGILEGASARSVLEGRALCVDLAGLLLQLHISTPH